MKYTKYDLPERKIITNIDSDIIKNFKNYLLMCILIIKSIWTIVSSRGEEKLSVFDKSKLNEIVWTKDVCDFSLGLFLPPSLAWKGIKEFLKTGIVSTEIEWISPEGGNY